MPGREWTGGPDFGMPEENCCLCGRKVSPPPLPPSPSPPPLLCDDNCPFIFNGVCQVFCACPLLSQLAFSACSQIAKTFRSCVCSDSEKTHPAASMCPRIARSVRSQDGGPGAMGASCEYGADCGDCGAERFPPLRPSPRHFVNKAEPARSFTEASRPNLIGSV
eukprot:6177418-Pleurochrysis_carterae.AAC.2